jgi:tetratricopeptide (TPR) repeat protein
MLKDERGGIETLLLLLLLVIVLFVGFQVWTKRTQPEPTLTAQMTTPPQSAPVTRPSAAPAAPPPAPRAVQAPPITAGQLAAAALQEIHQLITKGAAAEAEAKLKALPPDALNDPQTRQAAGILWNNLGLLKGTQAGTAAGVAAFKMAVTLHPDEPAANLNLLYAYWDLKDSSLNRDFAEKVIRLNPDQPLPHLALANMLYDRDDLNGAAQHLDHAKELTKQHPELQSYLELVSARVKRAGQAEQRFASRQSDHFMVKFDGGEDYAVWDRVLDILEEAYREIGQRFSYYPSQPLVVVLHTKGQFQAATGSPAWADGLYDGILGRIQIPTQGALTDQQWLTRVLRHEYVHALLHNRTGGQIRAVPQWLNEGLAMQLAGDAWPDIDQVVRGEVTLVPLNYLEGGWSGLPHNAAIVAYMEGNSATRYLIDRYGMGKVQDLIENMAKGQHVSGAMKDRLYITYEQFQERWVEELNERIRMGRT